MRLLSLTVALALGLASPILAQTLDRIRESNEIKLGYRLDAAPISYADKDGNAAGYSPLLCVAIAQTLAKELELPDLKISFHPVTTGDQFEKVASGEIDLLCGATTITLDRRKVVDFSLPIYVDGAVVLLPRNGSPDLKTLAGKRVGARKDTTTAEAMKNSFANAGIDVEEVLFDSHDAGVEALKNGEIDAYFGDQTMLVYQVMSKNLGDDLRLTDRLLSVEKQGLALAHGDDDFRLAIDRIISASYRSGGMAKLFTETLPGIQPGPAIRALHLLGPDLP